MNIICWKKQFLSHFLSLQFAIYFLYLNSTKQCRSCSFFPPCFYSQIKIKYGCLNVLDVCHRCKQNKHRMWKQKLSQRIHHVQSLSRLTEAGRWKHGSVHTHISGGRAACAGQELQSHRFSPQNVLSCFLVRCCSSAFSVSTSLLLHFLLRISLETSHCCA